MLAAGERVPAGAAVAGPPDFADRRPVAWSELVPSWPDDVDLDPAVPGGVAPVPPSSGGVPAARGAPADLGVRDAWGPAPIDPSAWTPAGGDAPVIGPAGPDDALAGSGSLPRAVTGRLQQLTDAGDVVYVADRGDGPAADDDGDEGTPPPPSRALGGTGAFGGGGGRFGAFDPGRRGTKALAAVAAVVVLLAAFLAWRARPRVDPVVEPPPVAEASADVPAPAGNDGSAPAATLVVAVEGKVGKPGVVRLPAGARVADALAAAGGAKPGVDTAMLNLARKVVDGELILVGVAPSPGTAVAAGPAAAPGGPVNLNTATLADLDTLPGVGPVLAQRILDARTAQGGFRAVGDLRKVDGIGSSRYEQLKELVTV